MVRFVLGATCAMALAACGSNAGNNGNSGVATDTAKNSNDIDEPDISLVADVGPTDAAPNDAGPTETGPNDIGPLDNGTSDLSVADQVVADAGNKDAAPIDAAATDSDAGPADAGDVIQADIQVADSSSGCAKPQPPNTTCEGTIWMCADGYFKGYGKTECIEANCDNLIKEVWAAIDDMVGKSKACNQDDDCVIASTSTACQGSCGAAVNSGMQNDVMKIVGWVDDNLCKKYGYAAKCGYATPKCMAPAPACVAGKCQYNKTVP